jgi:hypothetical protein
VTFQPSIEHTIPSLKSLLALAMQIDADMTWMTLVEKPLPILVEGDCLQTDAQFDLAAIFCS